MFITCEKKRKTSQYKGVTWNNQRKKWRVQLHLNRKKSKFGGNFKDELDAGKRVNQLCEELGIPPQNPTISAMPNQQYQVTKKFVLSYCHCEIIRTVEIYFFNFSSNSFFLELLYKLCFNLNICTFLVSLVPKINLSWMQILQRV